MDRQQISIKTDELISAFRTPAGEPSRMLDLTTGAIVASEQAGDHYKTISTLPTTAAFMIMNDFIDTLPEGYLRGKLEAAVKAKGAFRQFKEILLEYPEDRKLWVAFERAALTEIARNWLEDEGVDAELSIC